ncbi:MAG: ELM1/GtrOC1 family putative glycosyltransferase [Alphaproteobacteria bacterium]
MWVLLGHRAGDNGQALTLGREVAAAVGAVVAAKRLRYTALHHAPNWLLGTSLAHLAAGSDPLAPPWPRLVVGVGKRSVPVARWIRRQSGGVTLLVQIGRPFAPLGDFDLIVSTPQYGLPARPNIVANTLPLNRPDPAQLTEAADRWAPRLAPLPRPWTAVLAGGDSVPYRLDAAAGAALAERAAAATGDGSLLASTSPRTPPPAATALEERLRTLLPPERLLLHRWRAGAENPYPAFLALADRFLVTADSASMLAEAASTGRPVDVVAPEGARAIARPPGRFWRFLAETGIATPPRDMSRLQAAVRKAGDISAIPRDDMERAVARAKDLFLRASLDYMRSASAGAGALPRESAP